MRIIHLLDMEFSHHWDFVIFFCWQVVLKINFVLEHFSDQKFQFVLEYLSDQKFDFVLFYISDQKFHFIIEFGFFLKIYFNLKFYFFQNYPTAWLLLVLKKSGLINKLAAFSLF